MCLHVELVSRSKDYVRSRMKIGSVVYLYTPVSPSVPEMEGIYATGGFLPVFVSRCDLAIRCLDGKQKDLGLVRFGSPFSSLQKLCFMDTVL